MCPRLNLVSAVLPALAGIALWIAGATVHGEEHRDPPGAATQLLDRLRMRGASPSTMVRDSLHREAAKHFRAWQRDYAARTDPDEIAAYQQRLRQEFIERIGGLPKPAPLRAQVTGTIERDGFSVERVLFESQPQFFVTAGLFLPDPEKFPPPWPAVIVLCGHSNEGKQYDGYQRGTALAALNGLAAMVVDPIGQGERMELFKADGLPADPGPTIEHTLLGTGAILVGWNTARWMIADAIAAVDYLQSREDIQGDKIGCMGNSGGGTQTSYLMALEDRITVAAPSCYITSFERLLKTIGPQDAEQNIFGQIALRMDHADYLMMRAPKPTLIACATRDFFDIKGTHQSFRAAKRLFDRLGGGGNIDLVEVDATHGWHPVLRQASVEFMVRHLTGRVIEAREPDMPTLTIAEMNVTPAGQVLKLPGAVSSFEHVRQEAQRLAHQRSKLPADAHSLRHRVRSATGIDELSRLPAPRIRTGPELRIGNQTYEGIIFQVQDDIWLPGLIARPQPVADRELAANKQVTLLLFAEGKEETVGVGREVEQRVSRGETVLSLDMRGVGETLPTGQRWYDQRFGDNGSNAVIAYLLGKSLVGMRAQDCLVVTRWLAESEAVERVNLVATGELTIPALHAAALESERFDAVELHRGVPSWSHVVDISWTDNQIPGIVHAALRSYDLPDLMALLGKRLAIHDPYDASNKPLNP